MNDQLAAIGLSPLLIAQALYVKCVTPKLPEPSGSRSGRAGDGPVLKLMILGDSAAAGVGVETQHQALSGQLAARLSADYQVIWKLIAKTGHKTKDVLSEIQKLSPEKYDVVVTSMGVNDVTHGTGMDRWISRQKQMIDTLHSKFNLRHIILSGVPPIHLFPALPQPLRWYFGQRAKQFNKALQKLADDHSMCEFVSIHFPLEPSYMADDGFHPGASAYYLWAEQLAAVIQDRLETNVPASFSGNLKMP